jgi:diguanylate cyclase (GGDEF)-like protein/PAS domain S-box-containing protein
MMRMSIRYLLAFSVLGVGGLAVVVFAENTGHTIWIAIAIIMCAVSVLGVVAWFHIRRFLDLSIHKLLTVSARWRGGDGAARAGGATGVPEPDRPATSFDEMAAAVVERDKTLEYLVALSRAITRCAAELVTGAALEDTIPRILKTMGEAFNVDRIPVLEVSAGGHRALRYVWHNADAPVELAPEYLAALPLAILPEIEAWLAPLGRGEVFATSAKDAHGVVKTIFDTHGIVSNLQAPIHADGSLWGQLAIDDCRIDRSWTESEIDALKVLADLIGASIARQRRDEKLANADEVVRNSPAILFRISVTSGSPRMTYISDNVALLGYGPAALTGDPTLFLSLIHPDDRVITQAALADAMSGTDSGMFEIRIVTATGEYRSMENRHTATRDESGRLTGVAGVLLDVTERRNAEEELQFANTILTTQSETSPDAIIVVDKDKRFTSLNRRFAEMWHVPPDVMASGEYTSLFERVVGALKNPEAAGARIRHFYDNPMESGFDELETVDGRFIDRHTAALRTPAGVNLGRIWFYRDATERNRAEIALKRERDLSAAIINNLPGIFFVSNAQGRLVHYNKGLTLATAEAGADLLGTDMLGSVSEADRKLARSKFRETFERGHAEAEIDITNYAGAVRRYLLTTGQLQLEEGPGILGVGIDVTDARRVEKQLQASDQRFRTIFSSVRDGILVRDIETGVIVEANQSVCDMFGYTQEEILTVDIGRLSSGVEPYTRSAALQRFAEARAGGSPSFEWESKAKDGHIFNTEVTLRRLVFGDRHYMLSTLADVTDRKRHEAKILEMARLDSLTGLANRSVFADAVQQAIARAHRGGKSFAVIYLDMDHFKDVNDTLGHPVGDALLKLVSERLRDSVRGTDTVARFGGDEFAVLEAEIGDPMDAGVLAAELMRVLATPFSIGGNEIRSGASIGISVYGPDAADAETLLTRADVALYRAKAEGRGTYRFFTDAMDAEVHTRVSLGTDLRAAIGTDQLFLQYQLQVEAATGRITGVEALARWHHPTRGMVPPAEFIAAAERNGLIVALGHWVLWEACHQGAKWHAAGIAPAIMSVNLSAMQFKSPLELEKDIAGALAASGLPPPVLELEITESALMDASRDNNNVLERLRESGVRLALDDFGTGYSSLDYLRRFPMDRIKIAQNFVLDLDRPGSAAVVRATIGLARELGIDVIAEGVETEMQLRLLQSWGCLEVQGYYFAKPKLPDALEPLLRVGRIIPTHASFRPAA